MQDQEPVKLETVKPEQMRDSESEWSLDSLEDLKGLNLNDLREEDQREGEPQKQKQRKKPSVTYPTKQVLTPSSLLHEVGRVVSQVGELYIVEVTNHTNIVDLDNWLFTAEREMVGFVIDVFGRVDQPFYAVKLREGLSQWPELISKTVYFADGCKTLTEDDIASIKAKNTYQLEGEDEQSEEEELHGQEGYSHQPRTEHQKPRRRRSFDQRPVSERERTREKKSKPWREENPSGRRRQGPGNQAYLENMYSMYYNQMMQLYQQGAQMPPPIPPSQFQGHPFPQQIPPFMPNGQAPGQFSMHQGNRPPQQHYPPFPPQ